MKREMYNSIQQMWGVILHMIKKKKCYKALFGFREGSTKLDKLPQMMSLEAALVMS